MFQAPLQCHGRIGTTALIAIPDQRCIGSHDQMTTLARLKIAIDLTANVIRQGVKSRFGKLGRPDEQGCLMRIVVSYLETQQFATPHPGGEQQYYDQTEELGPKR